MTAPNNRPTRVLRPPRRVTLPSGQKTWEFDCDDGKSYTSDRLAKLIGLSKGASLVQRMARMGWDSDSLLADPAKRGMCLDGQPGNTERGTPEWRALSGKDRSANLWKISPAGSWEMRN